MSFSFSGSRFDKQHRQLHTLNILSGLILVLTVRSDKNFNDVTVICNVISEQCEVEINLVLSVIGLR